MKALHANHKATLRKSSPPAVADAMRRVSRHFENERWLADDNRYRKNTAKKIAKDLKAGALNEGQLKQYIAASVFPHCTDGWSFLGRAINAHQNGHTGAALHFAYYAELRAAMSLLATRGVGIFNKKNFVIAEPSPKKSGAASPTCLNLPGNTHEITWQALEYWGRILRFDSAEFLLGIISPSGISLLDWLAGYAGNVPNWVGHKWLSDWGVDLRQFAEDRELRNQVSYRPSDLNQSPSLSAKDASSFLTEFWSVFEPSAAQFDLLDRHILRASLEEVFQGRTGRAAVGDPAHENSLEKMVDLLQPSGTKNEWLAFLKRQSQPNSRLLALANVKSDLQSADHHLQVISRAALLLRLATGACNELKREAAVERQDLRFWWSSLGIRRGLWAPAVEPAKCSDLWADVSSSLRDERSWQVANAAADPSYSDWRSQRSQDFLVLGQCERIALWGLGL